MFKKIIYSFFLILLFSSCKEEKKGRDSQFDWLDRKAISNKNIPINNDNQVQLNVEQYVEQKLKISDVISNFSFLSLKENINKIGNIDKILFNDDYVFLLDKYTTESLHLFDRKNGEQIIVFNEHGRGPTEFTSIYDFDVDYKNKEIYIFDGENLKCLKYSFDGRFIISERLPFRIGNIRKLRTGGFVNFPQHAPNFHFGDFFSDKDIIVTDSLLVPKYGGFTFNQNAVINDFYSRDYFGFNNDTLSYFPRFKNQIYELNRKEKGYEFISLVKFDLGNYEIPNEDFVMEASKFISNRRKDNKLFSNGNHFVSNNWIGTSFRNFGGIDFSVFYDRRSERVFAGTGFEFDFKGLPFFGFPTAINKNECVTVIDNSLIHQYKNISDKNKQYYIDNQVWSHEMDSLMLNIEDTESPVLLFYNLK
ncbi:6-bladed beta-propeller [Tenacibaculum tangerinum]|uniref:6-bladed beta-propeller n=1 Tax=Tenacibaculum tangerinum TaxID=3038772 RepID=A0ABY8KY01_9FLAO|nr:6-bladed beta-propeller [Tenacibaculum tangerinum]WGH74122.1 6-bladed beta-propeller [Tenacibaculum tangerinum]